MTTAGAYHTACNTTENPHVSVRGWPVPACCVLHSWRLRHGGFAGGGAARSKLMARPQHHTADRFEACIPRYRYAGVRQGPSTSQRLCRPATHAMSSLAQCHVSRLAGAHCWVGWGSSASQAIQALPLTLLHAPSLVQPGAKSVRSMQQASATRWHPPPARAYRPSRVATPMNPPARALLCEGHAHNHLRKTLCF